MKKIAVIYDSFPHYRSGIIKSFNASNNFCYSFFGSKTPRDVSIKTFDFDAEYDFFNTNYKQIGPFVMQNGLLLKLIKGKFSACIFLGNPYFLSSWFIIPILRFIGVRVYFWSHGWISKHEFYLKRKFRNIHLSLANSIFLYGDNAKKIGIAEGFDAENLHVIHNSLDYSTQKALYTNIKKISHDALCNELGVSKAKKIIICSARLTHQCRFDILLGACNRIKSIANLDMQIVLVGDGPERQNLEKLTADLGVDVIFWGACYDEEILCKLYTVADLTVSPGKVGLTAIHSMAYGTPVISHNNSDRQGPEYEAIVSNVTGDFFTENSEDSLSKTIKNWFLNHPEKPIEECIDCVESYYTPTYQRTIIEAVLRNDLKQHE